MVQAHVHSILPKDDLHCMHNRAGFWFVIVQVSVPIVFYLTCQLDLVLSLWSQPLLYLLISLFINLSSWKKMAITLIPCFVSHSWTRDLVENIDFLMLQHCSLLFWIGGTILVLGAEFRIQNSELINDVKDDRNLMAENASIIHPCTFWGFSFQSLPATRTQFLWKRTERLVNLLLEWMAQ